MNRKQLKRFSVAGFIPMDPKYFVKTSSFSVSRYLERNGWTVCGAGYADSQMLIGVYKSYFKDETVVIEKQSAIPHYGSSEHPDYWMYGELIKRHYIYHYTDDDRLEDRGCSFHRRPGTLIIEHEEFTWEKYTSGWWET